MDLEINDSLRSTLENNGNTIEYAAIGGHAFTNSVPIQSKFGNELGVIKKFEVTERLSRKQSGVW